MDLQNDFESKLEKIEMLNNFISLYGKKEEIVPHLRTLSDEVNEIKMLLASCTELMAKFQVENQERFNKLMLKIQTIQTQMLDILECDADNNCIGNAPTQSDLLNANNWPTNKCPSSALKENVSATNTPNKFVMFKPGEQAVMTISEYMKSPYTTKRVRPIQLQFADFERIITQDEFNQVPTYMRGRETLDDIQHFLETVLVQCFTVKYTLLPKRREAVAPMELDIWNLFKSQEEYFKGKLKWLNFFFFHVICYCSIMVIFFSGQKFVTQGDICRIIERQIDKKSNTRLTILRHLRIIREERKNSAICYIWCKS